MQSVRCDFKSRLGDMYSIQYYVIKFSPGTPVSSTNKTDRHDVTDILLKVALSFKTLTLITSRDTDTNIFLMGNICLSLQDKGLIGTVISLL